MKLVDDIESLLRQTIANLWVWALLLFWGFFWGYSVGNWSNPMLVGHYTVNVDREIHHCYRSER